MPDMPHRHAAHAGHPGHAAHAGHTAHAGHAIHSYRRTACGEAQPNHSGNGGLLKALHGSFHSVVLVWFMMVIQTSGAASSLRVPAPQVIAPRHPRMVKGRIPIPLVLKKSQAGRVRLGDPSQCPCVPVWSLDDLGSGVPLAASATDRPRPSDTRRRRVSRPPTPRRRRPSLAGNCRTCASLVLSSLFVNRIIGDA